MKYMICFYSYMFHQILKLLHQDATGIEDFPMYYIFHFFYPFNARLLLRRELWDSKNE